MDFTPDDKDLIAKLWKRESRPAIKPLQFVLMTAATLESIDSVPRFALPKDRHPVTATAAASADPTPEPGQDGKSGNTPYLHYVQEKEEKWRLEDNIRVLKHQQETLEEARSTLQHEERLKKLRMSLYFQ